MFAWLAELRLAEGNEAEFVSGLRVSADFLRSEPR
jgi:hypothetical protein